MKLLDDDGENQAVRWFLACYGGGGDKSIGTMKLHLEMSGFDGCWPDWCYTEHPSTHLTKGGAQLWIRHLFSLEAQQVVVPAGYVLVPIEPTPEMLSAARNAPMPAVFLDSFSAISILTISTQYKAMLAAAQGVKP